MKRSKFINILLIICPIAILWHWGVISFDFGKINLNNIFGTGFYYENGFINLKGNEYPPELIWFLLFCVSIIVLLYRIFSPERKIQHDSNNKENINRNRNN